MPRRSAKESDEAVLWAIRAHTKTFGHPPTFRQIAAAVGVPLGSTVASVSRLQLAGFIRRCPCGCAARWPA